MTSKTFKNVISAENPALSFIGKAEPTEPTAPTATPIIKKVAGDSTTRSHRLQILVTEQDSEDLKKRAWQNHLSVNEYINRAIKEQIEREENR